MTMMAFVKQAFADMKESAKAQHAVDKANFAAAKAESKARWAEAKAASRPATRKAAMKAGQDKQIAQAEERTAAAAARIQAAKV